MGITGTERDLEERKRQANGGVKMFIYHTKSMWSMRRYLLTFMCSWGGSKARWGKQGGNSEVVRSSQDTQAQLHVFMLRILSSCV